MQSSVKLPLVAVVLCATCMGQRGTNPVYDSSELVSLSAAEEEVCGIPDVKAAVDRLLSEARTRLDDPLDLPNRDGIVSLTSGQMWGMTTLNRSGPVSLTCDDSLVTLRIPLKAEKPLRARYEWDKKVLSRTVKGVAYARATDLEATVTVQAPRPDRTNTEGVATRVTGLEVIRLDDVEVNVSGLAHISWLWSRAITFLTNVFNKALAKAVQERWRLALDQVLQKAAQDRPITVLPFPRFIFY